MSHEHKWQDGTLTIREIEDKVEGYCDELRIGLLPKEIQKFASMIYRVYNKYHNHEYYLGDFGCALAEDSYKKICNYADSIDRRGLYLYHYYFYNNAPGDWRKKVLA